MDTSGSKNGKVSKITLYQWGPKPEWKLASFDPHCLIIQAYMKFAKVPYDVNSCNNPHMSPSNTLPMLVVNGERVVTNYHNIITFLSEMGYDLDRELSEIQKADVRAYSVLLDELLYSAQLYNWWMEPTNYNTVTHLTFAKALPFPLSWFLPRRLKQRVTARLRNTDMHTSERVYSEAESCYRVLSTKLGEKTFFFGDTPCTLDAIAFGYLATQLVPPFPNRTLHTLIAQHSNLVRFCNHILDTYFGTAPIEVNPEPLEAFTKKVTEAESAVQMTPEEERIKYHNKLAVLFGLGATLLYTFVTNRQLQELSRHYLGDDSNDATNDDAEDDEIFDNE
jgi:metaxin